MLIKELMIKKITTVKDDADVRSICRLLTKHNSSGFPVVNKSGKLVGYISERDIIAAVPRPNFMSRKARDLMNRKIRTIPDDAPINMATKIFSEEKFRQLPVLKDGRLIGVITRSELVKHMMGRYY
jgi:tRNA nucleotidyltransferase (CCA-adding enzyme)